MGEHHGYLGSFKKKPDSRVLKNYLGVERKESVFFTKPLASNCSSLSGPAVMGCSRLSDSLMLSWGVCDKAGSIWVLRIST